MRIPPSLLAAVGLVAGFAVARATHRREIGGAVFAGAGVLAARGWWQQAGPAGAISLSALYAGAMGGSHPLARRIGAWPSVLVVTAVTVAASELLVPRTRGRR